MAEEVMGAFPVLNNLTVCEVSMQDMNVQVPIEFQDQSWMQGLF